VKAAGAILTKKGSNGFKSKMKNLKCKKSSDYLFIEAINTGRHAKKQNN